MSKSARGEKVSEGYKKTKERKSTERSREEKGEKKEKM